MKFLPTTKDSIALTCVAFITFVFFVAGLFDVLDYFIVKMLLFLGLGVLLIIAIISGMKNDAKKNRPEDKLQDDSH